MSILSDELRNDPLSRGYAGLTDEAAADDMNLVNRPVASLTSTQLATFASDGTLEQLQMIRDSGALQSEIDTAVGGLETRSSIPNGQTRVQELGLSRVRAGLVKEARRL